MPAGSRDPCQTKARATKDVQAARRSYRSVELTGASRILQPVERPIFCLPAQDRVKTSSASILRRGPLLLFFYSGRWCPRPNPSLRAVEEIHPSIEARGASLVAVAPQKKEPARSAAQRFAQSAASPS
ncbi:redoxin domain-containing protein [Bradyrhizobium liaoningense]|nr:redoxin domain-containing protein [Bradyrhizobium liaoningense]